MQEAKGGKINLLCDIAAISLIKVGNLKKETTITEDKIVLKCDRIKNPPNWMGKRHHKPTRWKVKTPTVCRERRFSYKI